MPFLPEYLQLCTDLFAIEDLEDKSDQIWQLQEQMRLLMKDATDGELRALAQQRASRLKMIKLTADDLFQNFSEVRERAGDQAAWHTHWQQDAD